MDPPVKIKLEMTAKKAALELIRRLPENVSIREIIAELYFRQKVDAGLRELDLGKGVSHERAKRRLKKWLA